MRPSTLLASLVAAAAFFGAPHLLAQPTPPGATRRAFPLDSVAAADKEGYELSLRELRRKSPAEFESMRDLLTLYTHMRLGRLGYIGGPFDTFLSLELIEAIRKYERDRGLAVTGDPLSFALARSLTDDEKLLERIPGLPSRRVAGTTGYVRVVGAWTFADMGDQVIAVEIDCDEFERRCVEAQAILGTGIFGGPVLSTDLQEWRVARWDAVEIMTEPVDFECARYVLRINLVQSTATKVRSTISSASMCAALSKDDVVIMLTDGSAVASRRALEPSPSALSPRASALWNRDARARP